MSANLINFSKKLFENITFETGIPPDSAAKLKVLVPKNTDDANYQINFVKYAALKSENKILNYVKFGHATYIDDTFVFIYGLKKSDFTESGLTELESEGIVIEEINAGYILYFINKLDIKRKSSLTVDDLIENILSQQDDVSYEGHSVKDLTYCFDDFCMFKISANSIFKDLDGEHTSYFICSFVEKTVLLPVEQILVKYRDLLKNTYSLFKENIYLSLTSTHFKHAFLELYRCIELLYGLPRAIKLKTNIGYTGLAYQLCKTCENELSWRRQEEDSLKGLLNLIDNNIIINSGLERTTLFNGIPIAFDNEENSIKSLEKVAAKIYLIRNQLVHQFELNKEVKINDSDWVIFISFLCSLIDDCYLKLKTELP